MEKRSSRLEGVLGMVIIASLVTGLAGLVVAVFAFFDAEWVGGGVSLAAAALAFGLLANALLRS
jgi:hypothetical protein